MSRARTRACCLLVSALVASEGHAEGGLTGGATELTQLMNNGELISQVAQQAKTVKQLADTHVVNYNQLLELIRSGQSMTGLPRSDVMKLATDMDAYQRALKTLGFDLNGYLSVLDTRITEARLQNLSLQDYVQRERLRVQGGNDLAKARLAREVAQAAQIKQDIVTVRDLGAAVGSTPGMHAATQLLNAQMNLMLQQMTRMVALTSEAQGSDKAAAMAAEAANRAAARSLAEQIISNETAMKQRNRQLIDGMRAPGY
jgi:conjugal transfer/entry exclusion protein